MFCEKLFVCFKEKQCFVRNPSRQTLREQLPATIWLKARGSLSSAPFIGKYFVLLLWLSGFRYWNTCCFIPLYQPVIFYNVCPDNPNFIQISFLCVNVRREGFFLNE